MFTASTSTPTTTAAGNAMSILDTITSLNQEASVRASSVTDKARKSQAAEMLSMQVVGDESEQDMSGVEEGDSYQEGKPLEEMEEVKLSAEVQALEVKTEETQEQMDLGREGLKEDVKMEQEESGPQEQTEEEKSKISGKPSEEKPDDDVLKSTSKAKQKARERIKEGELQLSLF